jgi:hypothetical protein
MPGMTRRQLRRDILKEMILRECGCQDQDDMRGSDGVKFYNNGPEEESGMIKSNLYTMSRQAKEIHDMIGMNDDLDEWVQEKIAVASSMLDSVYDYIGYEYKSMRGESGEHDSYNPEMLVDDEEFSDMDDEGEEEYDEYALDEVAPPGGEDVVRALKHNKSVKNPYAVAWSMHNKGEDLEEDDMIEPWEPLHQSTGIMFFEDQIQESRRRKRR